MSGCYLDRGGGKHETLHETQGYSGQEIHIGKRTNKGIAFPLGIYSGLCELLSTILGLDLEGHAICGVLLYDLSLKAPLEETAQFIRHR